MTPEQRCPSCGRMVQSDFLYCPYCQAALAGTAGMGAQGDRPESLSAPAEREADRDLSGIGVGMMLLGALGFVGVVVLLLNGGLDPKRGWSLEAFVVVGGGTILLVLAGGVVAGRRGARRDGGTAGQLGGRRAGVMSGLAAGCASAVMAFVLGGLLVVAAIVYVINDCLRAWGAK